MSFFARVPAPDLKHALHDYVATLLPTNRATDRGSLQKDIHLPGTSPQVPC